MNVIERLGFGCAYLTGGLELKTNLRLVDIAYDKGIRHFDVAPLYGIGTAEDVLGRSLAGRRDRVTIATKVGRPRPKLTFKKQLVRFLASPVRKFASSHLRRKEVGKASGFQPKSCFELSFVKESLESSLRFLRTDYLDLFLLHEVSIEDLNDELFLFLENGKRNGLFKCFGIASRFDLVREIEQGCPEYNFDAVQYSWSVLDGNQPRVFPSSQHITHRSIARAFLPLSAWFKLNPVVANRVSEKVGVDVCVDSNLVSLLVVSALVRDDKDHVLFSTRSASRLSENIDYFGKEGLDARAKAFLQALQLEGELPSVFG